MTAFLALLRGALLGFGFVLIVAVAAVFGRLLGAAVYKILKKDRRLVI